jgi:hypothetical protein
VVIALLFYQDLFLACTGIAIALYYVPRKTNLMKTKASTQKTSELTTKMMENADRYLMLHLDLFKHRHALSKTDAQEYQIEGGKSSIPAAS